MPTALIKGYHP